MKRQGKYKKKKEKGRKTGREGKIK